MLNPTTHYAVIRPPGYWRSETGGELGPAVEAYLNHRTLTLRQIALLRAYLCQWIESGVWDLNPHADAEDLRELRESASRIVTVADIAAWLTRAVDEGIDPL